MKTRTLSKTRELSAQELAGQLKPLYSHDDQEREYDNDRVFNFWVFKNGDKETQVYTRHNRPLEQHPLKDLQIACKELGLPIVKVKPIATIKTANQC